MLFYIAIGIAIVLTLGVFLLKIETPGEWVFVYIGSVVMVYVVFAAIAVGISDDVITKTYRVDDGIVHNEQYNGESHYYIVSDGDRVTLASDEDDEFFVSDENTVQRKCDYVPDWILPFDFGPCYWVLHVESVE